MCQFGDIVRVYDVPDPGGRLKKDRPVALVDPRHPVGDGIELVGVAITGVFARPLLATEIELPWQPGGHRATGLRKPSVAKCFWTMRLYKAQIERKLGAVPTVELTLIVEQYYLCLKEI